MRHECSPGCTDGRHRTWKSATGHMHELNLLAAEAVQERIESDLVDVRLMMNSGRSGSEIAAALGVSRRTAYRYISRIRARRRAPGPRSG